MRAEFVELTNMCMVRSRDGKYLVIDRRDSSWPGLVFPGGHVEAREAVGDSVVREVYEETGIRIRSPRLCGLKQFTNHEGKRYLVFFYTACTYTGELRSSPEGEALWLTMDEIRDRRPVDGFFEMLKVFENDGISELYYIPQPSEKRLRYL